MKTAITIIMATTAFMLGFFLSSAIDTIPKDVGTASHMGRLELALKDYYDKYRRFPETLDNLVDEGLIDEHSCSDMWGNEISYEVLRDSCGVRLTSQGNPSINSRRNFQCAISYVFSIDSPSSVHSDEVGRGCR